MHFQALSMLILSQLIQCGCVSTRKAPTTLAEGPVGNTANRIELAIGKAQVRAVHGRAWFLTGGNPRLLKAGDVLVEGTTLGTDVASYADLYLGLNGPIVRLLADSELKISTLRYTDSGSDAVIATRFNLRAGRLYGTVRKLLPESTYEVITAEGTASIRGADYLAYSSGDLVIFRGLAEVQSMNDGKLGDQVSTGGIYEAAAHRSRMLGRQEFERLADEYFYRPFPENLPSPPALKYGDWPGRPFN